MFKLDFNIQPSPIKIELKDDIYLIGSCFSDSIGNYFKKNKFNITVNPYGTLYNPISIFKAITGKLDFSNITTHQGIFYHWDCHSKISDLTKKGLLQKLQTTQETSKNFLLNSHWLIITLGSAHIYSLKKNNCVVANCHKIPNHYFKKDFLTTQKILDEFELFNKKLTQINTDINILLTVSPVRHIKDGLINNTRSKSILVDAIHQLVEQYSHVHYFPSYEIMMDELRDYRFYQSDRIHPSDEAVEYIWEKFQETFFGEESQSILKQWQKVQRNLEHRPIYPETLDYKHFLESTLKKMQSISPQLDLSLEKKALESKICNFSKEKA